MKSWNIVLVDDDAAVLQVHTYLLNHLGHKVTPFDLPGSALEFIADNDEVDMLITDFKMPGMDGMELISKVRKTHPSLPALVLSGFVGDKTFFEAARFHGAGLMSKPIRCQQLSDYIVKAQEQFQSSEKVVPIDKSRRISDPLRSMATEETTPNYAFF